MLDTILAPFDFPRQAAYNLAGGAHKLLTGQGDARSMAAMGPGVTGALMTALMGPGAGVLAAGGMQGLGKLFAPDTFEAQTPADLVDLLGGDRESWLQTTGAHLATDPLSYLGAFEAARGLSGLGRTGGEVADLRAAAQKQLARKQANPFGEANSYEQEVWKKHSQIPAEDMNMSDLQDYLGNSYQKVRDLESATPAGTTVVTKSNPRPFEELKNPRNLEPLTDRLAGGQDIAEKERAFQRQAYESTGSGQIDLGESINLSGMDDEPIIRQMSRDDAWALRSLLGDQDMARGVAGAQLIDRSPLGNARARKIIHPYLPSELDGPQGMPYDIRKLIQEIHGQSNADLPRGVDKILNLRDSSGDSRKSALIKELLGESESGVHPENLMALIEEARSHGFPIEQKAAVRNWRASYADRAEDTWQVARMAADRSGQFPFGKGYPWKEMLEIFPPDERQAVQEMIQHRMLAQAQEHGGFAAINQLPSVRDVPGLNIPGLGQLRRMNVNPRQNTIRSVARSGRMELGEHVDYLLESLGLTRPANKELMGRQLSALVDANRINKREFVDLMQHRSRDLMKIMSGEANIPSAAGAVNQGGRPFPPLQEGWLERMLRTGVLE